MASNTQQNFPIPAQSVSANFPARFFEAMTAYKQGAALKAAIELDLFTVLAEGKQSAESLALRLQASHRGTRILCDFLTIQGFLEKKDGRYGVTPDAAAFLSRKSPACIASAAFFLGDPRIIRGFEDIAGCVREGGTVNSANVLAPEHPVWVEFARSMQPIAAMDAEQIANLLDVETMKRCRVLDIAASHGMYGIALGRHNPNAEIHALDWKNVLTVARENAEKARISNRYRCIEGSAFEVEFEKGYDIVLLTNFLHHFSKEKNETFLRKVFDCLNPGGRAIALEFIPNDDRVTPQIAAEFSLMMLANTPEGDAYTFAEFNKMFQNAGFKSIGLHEIPPSPERVVIASR